VLQCVAVCCSVLQCVAVCCSVLQCVAVCCSVLQCVAVCFCFVLNGYLSRQLCVYTRGEVFEWRYMIRDMMYDSRCSSG